MSNRHRLRNALIVANLAMLAVPTFASAGDDGALAAGLALGCCAGMAASAAINDAHDAEHRRRHRHHRDGECARARATSRHLANKQGFRPGRPEISRGHFHFQKDQKAVNGESPIRFPFRPTSSIAGRRCPARATMVTMCS